MYSAPARRASVPFAAPGESRQEAEAIAVSQLRIFTIEPGKMSEWIKGWSEGVVPLRRKHGFRVEGAWNVEGEDTFVWVLTYDGPGDWESRDAAYYASAERKALDPDPARYIARAEIRFVSPVRLK